MKHVSSSFILLLAILIVAAYFRFNGLGWDSGYLLHPDERQIVLVASRLKWPANIAEFFSTESPLNPKFFAYGSFPIYLLRALGALAPTSPFQVPLREDTFVNLGLLGRILSALFDLGTIVLIYLLGRRLYDPAVGLVAAAAVAVTVLHIQLSHFYAVDTLLTFLVAATMVLALRFAQEGKLRDAAGMGALFGLAFATKITAVPLVVPIVVAVMKAKGLSWHVDIPARSHAESTPRGMLPDGAGMPEVIADSTWRSQLGRWGRVFGFVLREWVARIWSLRKTLLGIFAVSFAVFVITQPYALIDPIRYFGQVGTETLLARGWLDFPYTRQYANTIPVLYPLVQSSVWGMGLPLGLATWGGALLFIWRWAKERAWRDGFVLAWAFVYFLTIGAQYTKYLRYFLPLLPFLFLMMAAAYRAHLSKLSSPKWKPIAFATTAVVATCTLAYALAFSSIYAREHPWLQISRWIYQNIPAGATIAEEHWDDTLPQPMQLGDQVHQSSDYRIQTLPMYDPDESGKLRTVVDVLASSDYVVVASQRLYSSISRLPGRYPISSRYYQLLFSGQLGFELSAYARNDPALGGVVIQDDTIQYAGLAMPPLLKPLSDQTVWNWGHADESFVVYDHPLPLVFRKTQTLSEAELRALLMP